MALAWYVLRSKPFKEEFFWGQLIAHQIEVYYPSILAKVYSPRAHKAKPYFPGHLFIHVDLQGFDPAFLKAMPGSRGLVAFEAQPTRVPDAVITAIRCRVDRINRAVDERLPGWQPVGNVAIPDDPFAGHAAIFDGCRFGEERVRILIKLLRGMQLSVELPGAERM